MLVVARERVAAVHQDRRRSTKAGRTGLFGPGDKSVPELEATFGGQLAQPLVSDLPVGAALEVQQLNVHDRYAKPSSQMESQETMR